jgi:hypothetical protein
MVRSLGFKVVAGAVVAVALGLAMVVAVDAVVLLVEEQLARASSSKMSLRRPIVLLNSRAEWEAADGGGNGRELALSA